MCIKSTGTYLNISLPLIVKTLTADNNLYPLATIAHVRCEPERKSLFHTIQNQSHDLLCASIVKRISVWRSPLSIQFCMDWALCGHAAPPRMKPYTQIRPGLSSFGLLIYSTRGERYKRGSKEKRESRTERRTWILPVDCSATMLHLEEVISRQRARLQNCFAFIFIHLWSMTHPSEKKMWGHVFGILIIISLAIVWPQRP